MQIYKGISKYWANLSVSYAKTINGLFWSISITCMTIIMLTFNQSKTFSLFDLNIDPSYSVIPIILFTFFHTLFTKRFVYCLRVFWQKSDGNEFCDLFIDITTDTGFFMREIEPVRYLGNSRVVWFANDIGTWFVYLFLFVVLGLGAAGSFYMLFTKFSSAKELGIIVSIFLSGIVCYVNWIVASQWILAVSDLTEGKEDAIILSSNGTVFVFP